MFIREVELQPQVSYKLGAKVGCRQLAGQGIEIRVNNYLRHPSCTNRTWKGKNIWLTVSRDSRTLIRRHFEPIPAK